MDMKFQNRNHVISADKFTWSKFERTECGPQGERQDACNNRISSESLNSICTQSHWIRAFAGMTSNWDSSGSPSLFPCIPRYSEQAWVTDSKNSFARST